jgi:hypothetical protein
VSRHLEYTPSRCSCCPPAMGHCWSAGTQAEVLPCINPGCRATWQSHRERPRRCCAVVEVLEPVEIHATGGEVAAGCDEGTAPVVTAARGCAEGAQSAARGGKNAEGVS